jgi:transcriptional regulator with XRE-family HTH domain
MAFLSTIMYMKERIKQIMESQHMSQQVFADYLGINPATLSGIFNDRTKPTLNIVEAIRKKFPDISLDWLMFGTGDMNRQVSALAGQTQTRPQMPPTEQMPTQGSLFGQDGVLDFNVSQSSAPSPMPPTPQNIMGVRNTRVSNGYESLKIIDKPVRHVTEIRVYYDDQTWESFVPSKK